MTPIHRLRQPIEVVVSSYEAAAYLDPKRRVPAYPTCALPNFSRRYGLPGRS